MSDFELISLYLQQTELFFAEFTTLTTVLFAFLVAMVFMAKRLGLWLLLIVTSLFFGVMILVSQGLYASGLRAVAMGEELVRRSVQPDTSLGWMAHSYMQAHVPRIMQDFFLVSALLAVVFAFVLRYQKTAEGDRNRGH